MEPPLPSFFRESRHDPKNAATPAPPPPGFSHPATHPHTHRFRLKDNKSLFSLHFSHHNLPSVCLCYAPVQRHACSAGTPLTTDTVFSQRQRGAAHSVCEKKQERHSEMNQNTFDFPLIITR
ncbi:hypothetical protein AMELA_G00227150 [Ameiurus melas]|uniref:Uncharacterized protein n=1 Tax=Ameiurus melas TaxID=219545 RepID=A0A7J6A0D8_AMEME|nr:hypothetical protein AMELA_G00227150 [Ameiurus melas]